MKEYRKIFVSLAAASLLMACSDNLEDIIKANPGDEVQFGAALPGKTKTVYGEETSTGFPIYWVNGDLVKVASPQCMSGRNNAEYTVAVEKENQNYATSLTKTGDAGIQWGDSETAVFYSIYPSASGTALNIDGTTVTATLHVDGTQFASITDNGTSIYAQPAEMGNVVMYAKTASVQSGSVVELHYTPFSTVLEFEITAPDTYTGSQKSKITIQSLTLTAPDGTTIAGDFTFSFDEISATPATGGDNAITLHFLDDNQYTTVLSTTKQTLKAKMCLMPVSGVKNLSGWKVEVATSAGTFSKTLTDQTGELKPGLVHKIKLPQLNYASEEWVYDLDSWIPTLPDYTNIYLSEISLPGAWYAGSDEAYQATSDIATLWSAGVRAFAVECRTSSTFQSLHWTPNYVCISGTGVNTALGTNAYRNGTNITTVIESIKTSLENHPDEYAVLVLSYADGGEGGHRDEDHAFFLNGIANALSGYSDIIYGSEINANTTVDEVRGKLIIKVNVDNQIPIGDYTGMNALISYNPFLSQMTDADYSRPYYSDLYWSSWSDDYKSYDLVANLQTAIGNEDKFVWVFSSANRTQADTGTDTTIPTYAQRQSALSAMMSYSKDIYDASTHNVWFYFNCGGTLATSSTSTNPSPTSFATTMNDWLLNTAIAEKTDASPLGIVMFNQCTGDNNTYHGADIIKAIIEMNSKFYLKHAGTSSSGTGGTVDNTATNDSTVEDGGDAI
ncbi:MAG: hypothetical protein ACI399_08265 [Candidatus Cryptobacteroides sp.]